MSAYVPEGASSASSTPAADESSQPSGIRAAHVAGGGAAVAVGAVVVAICNHFSWNISDSDALLVGGAAVTAGVGLGHIISKVGVLGAFKQLAFGSKA